MRAAPCRAIVERGEWMLLGARGCAHARAGWRPWRQRQVIVVLGRVVNNGGRHDLFVGGPRWQKLVSKHTEIQYKDYKKPPAEANAHAPATARHSTCQGLFTKDTAHHFLTYPAGSIYSPLVVYSPLASLCSLRAPLSPLLTPNCPHTDTAATDAATCATIMTTPLTPALHDSVSLSSHSHAPRPLTGAMTWPCAHPRLDNDDPSILRTSEDAHPGAPSGSPRMPPLLASAPRRHSWPPLYLRSSPPLSSTPFSFHHGVSRS